MIDLAIARLRADLSHWPNLYEWGLCLLIFATYALLALLINKRERLFSWQPSSLGPNQLALLGFIAFFSPSLLEESVYRGLLIPAPSESLGLTKQFLWIAVSLLLYVLAHPVIAWLLWPWARHIFYRKSFLLIVLLLGLACTTSYLATSSLWPAVFIHWFTIIVWKGFYAGPDFNLSRKPEAL